MTNRFKGLDLVDRMLDELWTEVCKAVQEMMTKTIPKIKKCKKAKWLSEKALQVAEKIREVKGKEERERYAQLKQSSREQQGERRKSSQVNLCVYHALTFF